MRILLCIVLLVFCTVPGVWAFEPAQPEKAELVVTVGQQAPDFSLPRLHIDPDSGVATPDDEHPFRLADHTGKRPVLLVFSSFT